MIAQFTVELLIFSNHFDGRGNIDVQFHYLLTLTIFFIVLFCILEAFNDAQPLLTYGRVFFVLLQGTWFFQIAFALYHPAYKWDLTDHTLVPNVTFVFCMHLFAIFAALFLEFLIIKYVRASLRGSRPKLNRNETSNSSSLVILKQRYDVLHVDDEDSSLVFLANDDVH